MNNNAIRIKTVNSHSNITDNRRILQFHTDKCSQYLYYTILFALFFLAFSAILIVHGKSFLWTTDGVEQQYPFFVMEGNWLRELLANIFVNHSFVIPMWSNEIGYGADYYYSVAITLGNPINLLSVFCNANNAELVLNATVPITLYISGLIFLSYCSYKGFDRLSSLIAVFVYLFSGSSAIAFSQVYMLYPFFLAPLALYGVDKIFNGESPALLVVAVALSFMSLVQTGYMLCLLLVMYSLTRVLLSPSRSFRYFRSMLIAIAVPTILGICVSCIILLPVATNVLSQGRLGIERSNNLLYDLPYYFRLFWGSTTTTSVGADCYYGYVPLAFVCMGLVFADSSKEAHTAKWVLIELVVILLLPLAGRFMNGFAYPNNRWIWALTLAVALTVAIALPKLWEQDHQQHLLKIVAVLVAASLLVSLLYVLSGQVPLSAAFPPVYYLTLAIASGLVVFILLCNREKNRIGLVSLCSVLLSVLVTFYIAANGLWKNQESLGSAYESTVMDSGLARVADNTVNDENDRVDSYGIKMFRNSNIPADVKGCTFYNSFYNNYIDEYHTELGLASSSMNFSYCTLNSRSAMEIMAMTRYFLSADINDDVMVPPLFNHDLGSSDGVRLSETDCVAPIAYATNSYINRSEFESYNFVEKQNLMVSSAVLEDEDVDEINGLSVEADDSSKYAVALDFSVSSSNVVEDGLPSNPVEASADPVIFTGNTFVVNKPNSYVYLKAAVPSNCELYFNINNLNYREFDGSPQLTNDCKIFVHGTNMMQEIWNPNSNSHLYGGKNSWCVNTGYSDNARGAIALQFRDAGTYSFDSIELIAESCDWLADAVDEMKATEAEECSFQANTFTCSYDNEDNAALLQLRIPYSHGWSATINGSPVDIDRSNIAFMALPLQQGENKVSLTYRTPYLVEGALISIAGIVLGLLWCAFVRRRRQQGVADKISVPARHREGCTHP